ncbi:MAG: hypothetical protein EOM20_11565 [Spartobacteria bacterium]|nr:hypothetical protein [Spartobacteria bacterium]
MDCTLSGNTAASGGRGVYCGNALDWFGQYVSQSHVSLWNVIMGETDTNVTEFAGENVACTQAVSSIVRTSVGLTNVICLTGDPLLLPLADNGGLTPTMALQSGSAAYRAGTASGLAHDQRGATRNTPPCIGAYEFTYLLTGKVGMAMSEPLPEFEGGGGYGGFTVEDGALPPGLAVSGTGALTGTPTADGVYHALISATNASGTRRQFYAMRMEPPTQMLTPSILPVAQTGQTYSQDLTALGGTPPYTFELDSGDLPPFFMLVTNGTVLGFPNAGGSYSFNIKATDSSGGAGPFSVTGSCHLTVLSGAQCAPVPAGIAAWWRGEGNTDDSAANQHGTANAGVSYSTGEVGQAFSFNGTDGAVTLSNTLMAAISNNFTIEFWVWPTTGRTATPETNSGYAGLAGQRYALFPVHGGETGAGLGVSVGVNGISVFEHGAGYLPSLLVYNETFSGWTHVAVVYENKQPCLYVNGAWVRTGLVSPRSPVSPAFDFSGVHGYYAGLLDEVTVYDRVLSPDEIAALCNGGLHGKCTDNLPPVWLAHPAGQTLTPGESATLSVGVTGAPPVTLQWYRDGEPLAGETNATLQLENLLMGFEDYHVVAENAVGAVTGVVARVVVADTACIGIPARVVNWWRGESNALDEITAQYGTPVGNVLFTNGMVGEGFLFDGANSSVALPVTPNASVSNTFSIEFWAWPTADIVATPETNTGISGIGGQRYAIFPGPVAGDAAGAGVSVGANGVSVFEHGDSYLPSLLVHAAALTNWTHIAVVYEEKQPTLFINGSPVRTGLASLRGSVHPVIGFSGSYGYYAGLLDEIFVYDRALARCEIAAIYVAGRYGKCDADALPFVFDGAIHGDPWSDAGRRLRLVGGNGLPVVIDASSNLVDWIEPFTNAGSLGPVEFWVPWTSRSPGFHRARH